MVGLDLLENLCLAANCDCYVVLCAPRESNIESPVMLGATSSHLLPRKALRALECRLQRSNSANASKTAVKQRNGGCGFWAKK